MVVGGVRKSNRPELIGQRVRVRATLFEVLRKFRKRFRRKWPALFKSRQLHFHQDNTPVHISILVTDNLTKMGIKTVSHPQYSRDLAPCDFWLFPKLRGCRYETIEEMKEAVTKVIDTLTQEDFHGAFEKLQVLCSQRRSLRSWLEFHVCTINKSDYTKKVCKLIPCTSYIYIYIYIYIIYIYCFDAPFLPTS